MLIFEDFCFLHDLILSSYRFKKSNEYIIPLKEAEINEYQDFITNEEVGYQQNFALYNK